jgi:transposase
MLPVIEEFKKKFEVGKLVVIADSGLLSGQNIQELLDKGYEFILGARIKTEPAIVKNKILSLNLSNGQSAMIDKGTELKLVINYSEARAKKDKANRDKGIKKLEKQIQLGKLTKSHINNKGYNKFLKLEGEIKVSLNKSKLRTEAAWDGLKGYLTNTTLTSEEVIANYGELWKIEKAFRIAKTDLEIRPIYHRLRERIEAHICIAFAAYKVYKELERQLKEKHTNLSPEKAIEIAKTIYSIKVEAPISKEVISKTLLLTEEHKKLAELFDF